MDLGVTHRWTSPERKPCEAMLGAGKVEAFRALPDQDQLWR